MRQAGTATFEITIDGTEPPYVVTASGPGLDQPLQASLADHDEWLTNEFRAILEVMAQESITDRGTSTEGRPTTKEALRDIIRPRHRCRLRRSSRHPERPTPALTAGNYAS